MAFFEFYSSQSSLCNHNKNFHISNINDVNRYIKEDIKKYICNKNFSCRQSKYEHIKNVYNKKCNQNNNFDELKKKIHFFNKFLILLLI